MMDERNFQMACGPWRRLPLVVGALALAATTAACGDDPSTPTGDLDDTGVTDTGGDDTGLDTDVDTDVFEPLAIEVHELHVTVNAHDYGELLDDRQSDEELDAVVSFGGRRYEDCEFELHGGFARTVDKPSYRLKFDGDDPLVTRIFDPDGPTEHHRRVVLQASWIDPTFARNCVTFDLARDIGGIAPRCAYTELYVNGSYEGLYVMIERVDPDFLERQGLDDDGLLLKAESHAANWADKPEPMDGYDQKYTDAPTAPLGELLDALTHTPTTYEDFEAAVAPRLDLGAFMSWQMVHTLADNRDTFTKNYYLYLDVEDPDAAFTLISWDADATWGLNWDGVLVDASEQTRWHGNDRFSPRLFEIDTYRESYLESYALWLDDALLSQTLEHLAHLEHDLAPYAARDFARWERDLTWEVETERLYDDVTTRFEVMRSAVADAE